ncbi:hypothetical protein V5O48_009803 [Marasmius crinis-equi]|uniref:ER membrane protein complex subunit 4 n=1 Tax=Marasmius crinis-equi TaxID=585013 RepID=A0ABR3FA65_9AGAR
MSSSRLDYSSLETSSKWKNLPPPPGFSKTTKQSSSSPKSIINSPRQQQLKQDRAWDLAIGPAKSLPMQSFMLYMSGGGVQIFSMGIVFMLLLSPFRNIAGMNNGAVAFSFEFGWVHVRVGAIMLLTRPFAPFAPVESKAPKSLSTLFLQKLVYIGCNLLTLGVGLWKCRSMGLLPTGTGDWLAFEQRGPPPELSLF